MFPLVSCRKPASDAINQRYIPAYSRWKKTVLQDIPDEVKEFLNLKMIGGMR